jgi:Flp pilus assembly pilin Flp
MVVHTQILANRLTESLRTALRSDGSPARGQGLAEYALILALIAIVAIVTLLFLGGQISTILSTLGSSV